MHWRNLFVRSVDLYEMGNNVPQRKKESLLLLPQPSYELWAEKMMGHLLNGGGGVWVQWLLFSSYFTSMVLIWGLHWYRGLKISMNMYLFLRDWLCQLVMWLLEVYSTSNFLLFTYFIEIKNWLSLIRHDRQTRPDQTNGRIGSQNGWIGFQNGWIGIQK